MESMVTMHSPLLGYISVEYLPAEGNKKYQVKTFKMEDGFLHTIIRSGEWTVGGFMPEFNGNTILSPGEKLRPTKQNIEQIHIKNVTKFKNKQWQF